MSSQNLCFLKSEKRQQSEKSKYRISCDPVPVTAISCNHVRADVTQDDRTKEDASTSQPDCQMKNTEVKKMSRSPVTPLIEGASYTTQKASSDVRTG